MNVNIKSVLNKVTFSVLLVTIYTALPFSIGTNSILNVLDIPSLWWPINVFVLFYFWKSKKYFFDINNSKNFRVVKWYLLWNIICIFRGFFVAETYWDFKALISNGMALMIPIVAYSVSNKNVLQAILSFYVKYTIPLFILIAFLLPPIAYGYCLVPISFLILFFPCLSSRWKFILFAGTLIVIFADLSARSTVIKFGLPLMLLFIYYLRRMLTISILEFARKIFFIIPFFLFFLGVTGVFNVFKMDEYITSDYVEVKRDEKGQVIKENLKADTRTFAYVEVLLTAQKYDSWIFGRSPARGNISELFGDNDMNGRGERVGNEVAVLNVFTWTGIIGFTLFLMVFYWASYLAINKSNNIFSKTIGFFLAFRFMYSWVEDINNFSLTTFFLWIMIGFCISKSFREMSNDEIRIWVRGIFNNPVGKDKIYLK